jgi:hypothetical protein
MLRHNQKETNRTKIPKNILIHISEVQHYKWGNFMVPPILKWNPRALRENDKEEK